MCVVAFPPFLLSTHTEQRLDDEAEGDIKPCENRMYFNLQLEWNAHYLWMPTDWTVHSSPSDHMPSWRSLLHLTSVLASLWQPYYTASNGRCPMADVEFQPYLNYGKHKRTFLKRRTWTKSKIPTSYKNNLQQSPLKARLRRPATLATECSSPTTTAVNSGQGGGGAVYLLLRWRGEATGRQGRRRIRIRAHCNKDRTGDSSGGSTTLLNPLARSALFGAKKGAPKFKLNVRQDSLFIKWL